MYWLNKIWFGIPWECVYWAQLIWTYLNWVWCWYSWNARDIPRSANVWNVYYCKNWTLNWIKYNKKHPLKFNYWTEPKIWS